MHPITTFAPEFGTLLPDTAALLRDSRLVVHDAVVRVILEGSRGLRGGWREDSDIDLSLVINRRSLPTGEGARDGFLREILEVTLQNWRSRVELDTAVVHSTDEREGAQMFNLREYDEVLVTALGRDSLAVFKTQKGFNGYVPPEALDYRLMYPMLAIWER